MSVFKRFGTGDQIDNVLILEPKWDLASGSSGWHGAPEGSGSVSLYGGHHRSQPSVVSEYRFQRTIPGTNSFGPLARSGPITASVNFVYMTNEDRAIGDRSSTRWGYEHWKTIMRLYDYYSRRSPDYVTSSYDYYSLFFQRDSNQVVQFQPPAAYSSYMTSSFTVESWIKPLTTSSIDHDFTIASMNRVFWFGITGSTGQLVLSSSNTSITSSVSPALGQWSHVSVRWNAASMTGAFTINMVDAGQFVMTSSLPGTSLEPFKPSFTVGNVFSGSGFTGNETIAAYGNRGMPKRSFHGFVGETRLWYLNRTVSELSSSMSITLTGSVLNVSGSIICARFTDGPLAMFPTTPLLLGSYNAPTLMGSGTVDSSAMEHLRKNPVSTRYPWGWLQSFDDRQGPVWHPNDNVHFTPPKHLAGPPECDPLAMTTLLAGATVTGSGYAPVSRMLVLTVPAGMYGRRISPKSLSLTCHSFSSGSYGLVRTLIDDGRGGLYISGSAVSSSFVGTVRNPEAAYDGVAWNKVGNVFYDEGIVVIKDPALLDFAAPSAASNSPTDLLQVSFRGDSRIPVKTLMCRIDRGDLNASLNSTFWSEEEDGDRIRRHPSGSLYVTTVGIYNSDHELVGVARLAEPLRVRARDRMNIRLRMDF